MALSAYNSAPPSDIQLRNGSRFVDYVEVDSAERTRPLTWFVYRRYPRGLWYTGVCGQNQDTMIREAQWWKRPSDEFRIVVSSAHPSLAAINV